MGGFRAFINLNELGCFLGFLKCCLEVIVAMSFHESLLDHSTYLMGDCSQLLWPTSKVDDSEKQTPAYNLLLFIY